MYNKFFLFITPCYTVYMQSIIVYYHYAEKCFNLKVNSTMILKVPEHFRSNESIYDSAMCST